MRDPETARHQKKSKRKPFGIQRKYIGDRLNIIAKTFPSILGWHVYRRYATEEDRNKAMETIAARKARGEKSWGYHDFEYRIEDANS